MTLSQHVAPPPAAQSPWQSPSTAPLHPHPPPPMPVDLRSTSTVTTSSTLTSSPRTSTHNHVPLPVTASPSLTPTPAAHHHAHHHAHAHAQDHDDDDAQMPATLRSLPRCAVVNFHKDGDSLQWAPRVSQNLGGVSARAHNFEDAFTLEEFSSTALPIVWRSTGGDPRTPRSPLRHDPGYSLCNPSIMPTPTTASPPPPKPTQGSLLRAAVDMGAASQHSLVPARSTSRTMQLAHDMRRPSFWAFVAQSGKPHKAHAVPARRPDGAADKGREREQGRQGEGRRKAKSGRSARVYRRTRRSGCLMGMRDDSEDGDQEEDIVYMSLFRRLMDHLERRKVKSREVFDAGDIPMMQIHASHASRVEGVVEVSVKKSVKSSCQRGDDYLTFITSVV